MPRPPRTTHPRLRPIPCGTAGCGTCTPAAGVPRGWANASISAGDGIFIGPLWEVRDDSALQFARFFYEALLENETVVRGARQARLAARAAGDPTWLAYSIYAHPNARVVFQ